MTLTPGTRLSSYEILESIGAGGMGEVYKARDTKLGREVAIKVLPEAFAENKERLARFEREARLLASLNDPNIAMLFDFQEQAGTHFLVQEYVPGETLAERIKRGPIPVGEALPLFKQIAEGLEAAHEKGIIHRDLKPANIKVTPEGKAKVLDFGLAKALAGEAVVQDLSESPTLPRDATETGVLLGTPPYLSPEQARGKELDKRTDIWAFGCCLYEVLTGKAAFLGDTVSDTIARILEREPNWQQLPRSTPARVRDLLRRCLQQDPDKRPSDLSQACKDIEACLASPFTLPLAALESVRWSLTRPPVRLTLAIVLIAAAGLALYEFRDRDLPVPQLTNPVQVTSAIGVEDYPSPSPDARTLAYESNETGNWDIWVTHLSGERVNRTADHPGDDRYPSWSPDGRTIAFWSDRQGGGYFVMPSVGGTAQKIIATPATTTEFFHSPPVWSVDGTLIAAVNYERAERSKTFVEIVSCVTRESRRLNLGGSHTARVDLSWSQDGAYLAYVDFSQPTAEVTQLMLLRLVDGKCIILTDGRTNDRSPRWSADGRHLYYVSNRVGASDLWRQPIGVDGTRVGEPERVTTGLDIRHVAFSPDETKILYSKGRWISNLWRVPILADRPATWADAQQITFEQAFIEFMDVSRDGRQLVFSSDRTGNQDLWTMSVGEGEAVQLTADPKPDWNPRWSPDTRRLAFYSYRTGERQIWVMPANGGPAMQLTGRRAEDGEPRQPGASSPVSFNGAPDWSPDGQTIAFTSNSSGNLDVWVAPSGGAAPRQLTSDPAADSLPAWSPDGRWLAFTSDRAGTSQVWRMSSEGGLCERLTVASGVWPRWSPDGDQIYFIGLEQQAGNLWGVSVRDRTERQMTNLVGRRGNLGIQGLATDGTYLYFTWRDDLGDIWVMDVVQE